MSLPVFSNSEAVVSNLEPTIKYRNPFQVVVFPYRIVNRKVEYLLLHRKPERGGCWQGVSGGVEVGELIDKAAQREVCEETRFHTTVQSVNFQFQYQVTKEMGTTYAPKVKEITEYTYVANVTGLGEPTLSDEHDGYKWVPFEEIDIAELEWAGSKKAIKIAHQKITKQLDN